MWFVRRAALPRGGASLSGRASAAPIAEAERIGGTGAAEAAAMLARTNGQYRDLPRLEELGVAEDGAFRRFDLAVFLAEDPPEQDYLLEGFLEYGELCWLAGRGQGRQVDARPLPDERLPGRAPARSSAVRSGPCDWGLYIDGENREATVRRRVHLAGMSPEVAARIDYRSVRGVDLGSPEVSPRFTPWSTARAAGW